MLKSCNNQYLKSLRKLLKELYNEEIIISRYL